MLQGAGESIELPHEYDIEKTLTSILLEHIQLRSAPLGSAHAYIYIFAIQHKALPGIAPEVLELDLAVLIQSTDPCIEGGALGNL
jgi:hypothetical protein